MTPTRYEKQGRGDKVLAVEEEKERVARAMPACLTTGRAGPRSDGHDCRVASDRGLELLIDAQVGQSTSPSPSQRMRKGSEHLYVLVLTLIPYMHGVFPVKSFVDSGNNGLDGVRIAFAAHCAIRLLN